MFKLRVSFWTNTAYCTIRYARHRISIASLTIWWWTAWWTILTIVFFALIWNEFHYMKNIRIKCFCYPWLNNTTPTNFVSNVFRTWTIGPILFRQENAISFIFDHFSIEFFLPSILAHYPIKWLNFIWVPRFYFFVNSILITAFSTYWWVFVFFQCFYTLLPL